MVEFNIQNEPKRDRNLSESWKPPTDDNVFLIDFDISSKLFPNSLPCKSFEKKRAILSKSDVTCDTCPDTSTIVTPVQTLSKVPWHQWQSVEENNDISPPSENKLIIQPYVGWITFCDIFGCFWLRLNHQMAAQSLPSWRNIFPPMGISSRSSSQISKN